MLSSIVLVQSLLVLPFVLGAAVVEPQSSLKVGAISSSSVPQECISACGKLVASLQLSHRQSITLCDIDDEFLSTQSCLACLKSEGSPTAPIIEAINTLCNPTTSGSVIQSQPQLVRRETDLAPWGVSTGLLAASTAVPTSGPDSSTTTSSSTRLGSPLTLIIFPAALVTLLLL